MHPQNKSLNEGIHNSFFHTTYIEQNGWTNSIYRFYIRSTYKHLQDFSMVMHITYI